MSGLQVRRAPSGIGLLDALQAVWEARGLLGFLVWRDLKVRYRQTAVGAGWAVLQPVVLMVIFAVFLTNVIAIPNSDIPYWLFVFTGLVPWLTFSQSLLQASNSVVNHTELIRKSSFPRLVLPTAAVGPFLVDFVASSSIAVLVSLWVVQDASSRLLVLPGIGVLATFTALAAGVGLSALNVSFRDVKYATPFLVQAMLFATPVVYPVQSAPERIEPLLWINPMAGVVELFRWAVLPSWSIDWLKLGLSMSIAVILMAASITYFARKEAEFVDRI